MLLRNRTLGLYFMGVFTRNILGAFAICFALIFLVDLVERLREFADNPAFGFLQGAQMALYRAPAISEEVLPFAVLIGAIAAFVALTRKLELAITRSAGLSIWQFVQPGLLVAGLLGLLAALLYNPIAVFLDARAQQIELEIASAGGSAGSALGNDVWFRQEGPDGEAIVFADGSAADGLRLVGVTALVFDLDGDLREQVDARSANWNDGYWMLNQASVVTADQPPFPQPNYRLPTYLTREQVTSRVKSGGKQTFWGLPEAIDAAERAGQKTANLKLALQNHLAKPVFFAAMVIIAATVSLKLARLGGAMKLIFGGITAGFMLYIFAELVRDLGSNGLLHPALAAWLPSLIALLLGVTILLFQEDG